MAFNITTINVRSIKTEIRAQSVLSFLERFNSDVFLLQECGLPFLSSYRKWEDKWQHGPSIWSGSNFNKNDGVAILIKTPHVVVRGSTVVDREPVCPVRGLAIGEPTTVWRNVAHPALLNQHRDLSWMVAHEILPVRAVMHSRGMARTSACPRPGCGQEESVRHLLWECRAARDLWKEVGPLISPCLPAGEDLTPQLVLYGVGRKAYSTKGLHQALAHPHVSEGSTVVLPQSAGSETGQHHPPGSGHGSHRSPGVVQKEGGLDPRRRVPHNTQGPCGHGLTALRRLGRCT
eukprot:XP_014042784.1 PREDICTED: uncharacterized protein LOC106595972 [Salmo salar]